MRAFGWVFGVLGLMGLVGAVGFGAWWHWFTVGVCGDGEVLLEGEAQRRHKGGIKKGSGT